MEGVRIQTLHYLLPDPFSGGVKISLACGMGCASFTTPPLVCTRNVQKFVEGSKMPLLG